MAKQPPLPSFVAPKQSAASTQTPPEKADDAKVRSFPCEGCGADLEFHIGNQSMTCPFCGHVKAIEISDEAEVIEQDFKAMIERVVERRSHGTEGQQDLREVTCRSCAGTVQFAGTLTSTECPYCGVPLQLGDVHESPDRVAVDGVLPFMVDRKKARTNLAAWVKSRWFAPNEFKARGVQGKFSGVYLPYWTYDSLTFTRYTGMRGEHYYVTVGSGKNRRTVRRTRWYPAAGSFQRFFDDVLVVAGKGLPKKRIVALEPWPLNQCIPFNHQVIAGFLARTYDIPLDEGFLEARNRMDTAIEAEVRQRIGGDTQRITSIDTRYDAITYKHLLLPLWMLGYRYGKKAYQVVVNAATGEVQGDRPYSWIKITLAVLAGLITAAGIYYLVEGR